MHDIKPRTLMGESLAGVENQRINWELMEAYPKRRLPADIQKFLQKISLKATSNENGEVEIQTADVLRFKQLCDKHKKSRLLPLFAGLAQSNHLSTRTGFIRKIEDTFADTEFYSGIDQNKISQDIRAFIETHPLEFTCILAELALMSAERQGLANGYQQLSGAILSFVKNSFEETETPIENLITNGEFEEAIKEIEFTLLSTSQLIADYNIKFNTPTLHA